MSGPKTLSTTWPRAPDVDSSTLSRMGWAKLNDTPGISLSVARICSMSWGLVRPLRHSPWPFRRTSTLARFSVSLSVPDSGRPCSVVTVMTSGKVFRRRRTSRSTSWPFSSEIDAGICTST